MQANMALLKTGESEGDRLKREKGVKSMMTEGN